MRVWMAVAVVAVCATFSSGPAFAFGLGETMGAVAVQGTLAGTSASGAAGTIGSVRARVGSAVTTHNRALTSALGASAPTRAPSGATWMTGAPAVKQAAGQSWATLTSGLGGSSGWVAAEAFGHGAENAWSTASDAWARGGFLPN